MKGRAARKFLSILLSSAMVIGSIVVPGGTVQAEELTYQEIDPSILQQHAAANSEQYPAQDNDGPVEYAFNRSMNNWWHSRWKAENTQYPKRDYEDSADANSGSVSVSHPIWIETGFGIEENIGRLLYIPRDNGMGQIRDYSVWVADIENPDERPQTSDYVLLTSGSLPYNYQNNYEHQIDFPVVVNATHIRLQATSVWNAASGGNGDDHVAAAKFGVSRVVNASDVKNIINTPITIKEGCEGMGTVSVNYAKVVEGVDAVITATATVSDASQYRFVGWENENGEIVSQELTKELTVNTDSEGQAAYYAVFADMFSLTKISDNTLAEKARAKSEKPEASGATDGPAKWAFDTENHWWHTMYGGNAAQNQAGLVSETNPIWIETGFGELKNVDKMTYTTRGLNGNGNIDGYEIWAAKLDNPNDTPQDSDFALVRTGNFADIADPQEIFLDSVNGGQFAVEATHIRLQATSIHRSVKNAAAKYIEVYSADSAPEEIIRHIVNTPITVKDDCQQMGTVHLNYAKVVEGLDTVVTATAVSNNDARYQFLGWQDSNGTMVSSEIESTFTVNTSGKSYYAVFAENTHNTKVETEDWDMQMSRGTMQDQNEADFWFYQIKSNDNGWMNIPAENFHPEYTPENETDGNGSWMQSSPNGGDYSWSKLTRSEMTVSFGVTPYSGVAYAWRAKEPGYYKATLAENILEAGSGFSLAVEHVSELVGLSDGEILCEETNYNTGDNIVSRIAEVQAGDVIRFAASSGWVRGFKPVIEQVTAKEYAQQYLEDLAEMNFEDGAYTEDSKLAYTNAKSALENVIDSEEEDLIIEKIEALEAAVGGLETTRTVRYTNPQLGMQSLTEEDREAYAHMKNLTVEVLCKYDTDTGDTALFTIGNNVGNYLTVWHTLNSAKGQRNGRVTIAGSYGGTTTASGQYWSNSVGGEAGKWHKITFAITKNGTMTGALDANAYKEAGATGSSLWPPVQAFLSQDWKVSQALVGRKAANGQYNVNLRDFDGSVKYVKVSSTEISTGDAAVAQNTILDAQVTEEYNTFIDEQNSYAASVAEQAKYTKDSWSNFINVLRANSSAEKDWEKCNAIDEIKDAKDALIKIDENMQIQYWDKEVTLDKIAQQENSDVWKYQILHETAWEDLAETDFKSGADAGIYEGEGGIWLTDGRLPGNYYYAAIGRNKLTPCFGTQLPDNYYAVAYAWNAPREGYAEMYFAEKNPALGNSEKDNMVVEILQNNDDLLAKVQLTEDFSEINKDIFAGYAKVNEGDYLRVAAFAADNDLINVETSVKYYDSAKEWAHSYLERVNKMTWEENTYTKDSEDVFEIAKAALQETVDSEEDVEDTQYESVVTNMTKAILGLTPYVGAQEITVTSSLNGGVLNKKDQTTTLIVTVSPETATDPLSYTWTYTVVDGEENVIGLTPSKDGKSAVLDVKVRGNYTVTVTVTGTKQTGESLTASCTVNIANLPLTATAGVIGKRGGKLTVSATAEDEGGETAQIERDETAYYKAIADEGYVLEGWYEDAEGSQKLEVKALTLEVEGVTEDIQRYVKFVADKSELEALLNACKDITDEDSYMADSWSELQSKIQEADEVYKSEDPSVEEVKLVKNNLESAKNALKEYKSVKEVQILGDLTIEGPAGTSGTLQVIATPEDASNLTYSWTIEGERQIVTLDSIDSNMVSVSSVAAGTVTVRVTVTSSNGGSVSNTLTKECQVTVKIPHVVESAYVTGCDSMGTITPQGSVTKYEGERVELTAVANEGYKFVGWYKNVSGEGEVVETSNHFVFEVKEDITYYAKFEKLAFTMTVGVVNNVGGTIQAEPQSVEWGGTVVFKASPESGYVVKGWYKDSAGETELKEGSTNAEANTYTITNIREEKSVYVAFEKVQTGVDKTPLVQAREAVKAVTDDVEYVYSYTAESRALLDEALVEAEKVLNSDEATEREIQEAAEKLQAALDALERQYKIEVVAPGTITDGGVAVTESANVRYAKIVDKIVVTAPGDNNGHKFVCWMLKVGEKEEKAICYTPTYKFYVIGSMKLTPIYEEAQAPEVKPEVITTATYNKATKKATFTVKRSLPPEGYTVVGHGVILTDNEGKNHYDSTDDVFGLDATYRIKTAKGSTRGLNGTYSASMSCSRNTTWYAKGYVQYKQEGSDEIKIVYSDVCEITIDSF